jgi:hypothetical protein
MRSRLPGTIGTVLCALFLVGVTAELVGCSMPWASTSQTTVGSDAVINQATYELQAALGLSDGSVTRSTQPPILTDSDVALAWQGGRADVDLTTGHVRAVLIDGAAGLGPPLPTAKLTDDADRVLGLLGWDSVALEAQGFTEDDSKTVDNADAGTIYEKTWVGHDSQGVLNEGVIEVGLSAADGSLHSFLFSPGPEIALDMSKVVTKDEAVKAAKDAAAKSYTDLTLPSDTGTSVASTTTTKASSGKATTTTTVTGVQVANATLVHTDKAGITGGKDMLVWVVKVDRNGTADGGGATVYVDAVSGKVLTIIST